MYFFLSLLTLAIIFGNWLEQRTKLNDYSYFACQSWFSHRQEELGVNLHWGLVCVDHQFSPGGGGIDHKKF